jgi:hypothetical protein
MSAFPFTPGLWRVLSDDAHVDRYDRFEDGQIETIQRYVVADDPASHGPVLIADVWADYPDVDLGLPRHPNGNAALIAMAPTMLKALQRIASIPLWNETINDPELRAEYVDCGEYDADANVFEPSCDTESSYLEMAVEAARSALRQGGDR